MSSYRVEDSEPILNLLAAAQLCRFAFAVLIGGAIALGSSPAAYWILLIAVLVLLVDRVLMAVVGHRRLAAIVARIRTEVPEKL